MLIEEIRKDRMVAFKAKENIKKDLLGCLISESCKEDKEPQDQKVLAVIKKFIDGAKEMMEHTKESDYEYYKASMEIDILETYRPKQLNEEEIVTYINQIHSASVDAVGTKATLPIIMKAFKEHYEGQYDGKLVNQLIQKSLKED
jgi:uncharacterized protein